MFWASIFLVFTVRRMIVFHDVMSFNLPIKHFKQFSKDNLLATHGILLLIQAPVTNFRLIYSKIRTDRDYSVI